MGLFGQSTPFDADIEKATSETNTNENWSLILDVCDKVSSNPRNAKECLKAIMKRMGHADPHVVMLAITLLDACANNCGKPFHLEIASREFENEFRRLLSKAQPKVSLKMRQVLKNWAENDFKNDPELNLIPSLYKKLRIEGVDFSNLNEKPAKSAAKIAAALKDPNVVSSQQEEDDIAKAIELSLKETKSSPKHQSAGGSSSVGGGGGGAVGGAASGSTTYPSLYPSFSGSGSMGSITSTGGVSNNSGTSQPEPRKVRALYDFEAAEENELTFFAGEIIHVLDDSDPNWWKGFNQRGDGLFPSNFVTADLSVDPERLDINQQNKSKKSVQFEDDAKELQQKTEAAAAAVAEQRVEIDETKIDRLLHLLHEANPEDPSQDSDEMLRLEQEVHQMGPLIDAELERVDRKHAHLTQLSSDLVDAINLYHSLMRDDLSSMAGAGMGGGGYMPFAPGMSGATPGLGYQGPMPNPQMLYGAAGYPGAGGGSFPPQHQHQQPQQQQQQPQQMPQNYGMHSLQYTNAGQLPPSNAPITTHNSQMPTSVVTAAPGGAYPPSSIQLQRDNAAQPAMPIPMQFQNGHGNAPQMNGGGINALPQHMSAMPFGNATGQLPGTGAPTTNNSPMPPSMAAVAPAAAYAPNTQMQMPMPMPMHHNQFPNGHVNAPQMSDGLNVMSPEQQQQQQQQQYQQQQYAPMHCAPQPQTFMTSPPAGGVPPGMMQLPTLPTAALHNPNNGAGGDAFSQLQHQMAAMSVGGMNQPVTQNFLVQNEPKNNIPIYQQQR